MAILKTGKKDSVNILLKKISTREGFTILSKNTTALKLKPEGSARNRNPVAKEGRMEGVV